MLLEPGFAGPSTLDHFVGLGTAFSLFLAVSARRVAETNSKNTFQLSKFSSAQKRFWKIQRKHLHMSETFLQHVFEGESCFVLSR